MFLIFLSWIYIVFTTINLGFAFDRILVLKNKDFIITSFLGLFFATILASIWAIFGRINIEFHLVLLFCNGLFFFKFKKEIITLYNQFWFELNQLSQSFKIYLTVLTLLIIAQCSSSPFVIDNESYYIQTIKWLNEYGFVKGLANLHLFLGQTSGWHITQSVFNFSFIYSNFNDLSGLCLLLGSVFFIQKVNAFYQNKNINYLLVGLFPVSSIFLFQFISAPSPDIPVYILSFIVFFYFLEHYKKCSVESFNLIVIFILFALYIKNTTLTLLLIPIVLFLQNFNLLAKNLSKSFILSLLILVLYLAKNMIICGSIIFPSKLFDSFTTDYSIPNSVETAYYEQLKYLGYHVTGQQYSSMHNFELFLNWLNVHKLHGFFNKLSISLILITPFFIYKFQNQKKYWILYVLMLLQLLLLFATSPQYRFFMNFILFFTVFCFVCLVQNKRMITTLLFITIIPSFILMFIPFNLNRFTNNKLMKETNHFSIQNSVFPHQNTKNETAFEVIELGNLKYFSPIENDFFWESGNGKLPCVNKKQIDYYEHYFHIIPQMRTKELKDGFYAKKISVNE